MLLSLQLHQTTNCLLSCSLFSVCLCVFFLFHFSHFFLLFLFLALTYFLNDSDDCFVIYLCSPYLAFPDATLPLPPTGTIYPLLCFAVYVYTIALPQVPYQLYARAGSNGPRPDHPHAAETKASTVYGAGWYRNGHQSHSATGY